MATFRRARVRAVLLLLSSSLVWGTISPGARVARKHIAFAKELTAHHLRLSTDFADVARSVEEAGCSLDGPDAAKLEESVLELAQDYASKYCRTWEKFWDRAVGPCDADRPPAWCDDDLAVSKRIDLQGYFATLTDGIQVASSSLEADNIIDIVTSTLSAHVITEFPRSDTDSWAGPAVAAYLRRAPGRQALDLVKALKSTWVGVSPSIKAAFDAYLTTAPTLDTADRESLVRELAEEAPL